MSSQAQKIFMASAEDAVSKYHHALEHIFAGKVSKPAIGYVEIPTVIFVRTIDLNMAPPPSVDFYKMNDGTVELLRKAADPFSALSLSQHEKILIREEDFPIIRADVEKKILAAATDPNLPAEIRAQTLRRAAIMVVEDLLVNPTPENLKKSQKVVGSFVYLLMRDPKACFYLAQLSTHDPYTVQHSVGTAVISIILGRKMGINDETALIELGLGGLLHDVGKTGVKTEIINKPGPLNDEEWVEMKQHTELGFQLVKDRSEITTRTKRSILEHHEDKKGTGYPFGKNWTDVHEFSKIVGLCDVFNALTTERSYSKARKPFDAFSLIKDKMTHKIDDQFFNALVLIYGGKFL